MKLFDPRFANPKTDFCFKKIFGNRNRQEILISFLNEIIGRKEGEKIVSVTYIDPNNFPERIQGKHTIVDVRCFDQKGHVYIVEMQMINQKYFLERCQYYTCYELGKQLGKTDQWKKLAPVIFVGIANFTLFENHTRYVTRHRILDEEALTNDLKLIQFHFLELSKFKKTVDNLDSVIDQWAYFLKHATEFDEIPLQLRSHKEIVAAYDELERTKFTEAEQYEYFYSLDRLRSEPGIIEAVEEKACRSVAIKMLKKEIDIEIISEVTGFTIEDIKRFSQPLE